MSSVRTPPSLKWLIDKRARLLGEINKLEHSRDKKLEDARKRVLEAEKSLEQAILELACHESSVPMIIQSLRGDLQAVDNTLGLHEIQINCELSALRSHFVSGVMEPVNCRRNGATLFPA